MSSWFSFAKKYLWHEEKTPFHLPPSQLTKLQASNELKLFAIFEGIIAGMIVFGIYSHFQHTGETSLFPGLIYCLFLLFALLILIFIFTLFGAGAKFLNDEQIKFLLLLDIKVK